ncbi:TPA: hypothetical protein RPW15_001717 [Campylobacter fetus subsp. venerealis]|uniref:Uncharacterized protein n=2 Tax=Campylobacter fetus subsp. venerealis TaxID=32020 RepID=A0AAE6IZ54_CAMFE|nr:hypothetical protein [Campylobacter fetus]OCS29007.1 hypothetical protein CFVCCUG33900_08785 [Campylobacter fetus subsp. venerealis LMG 6570 = CCUG 33900]ACS15160.1 hypothetical protein [Campylobacter fetus subsp. venerealis NCTC 10354]AHE94540.1 hypothetical protein CFVI03293_1236 [Campylobacter fetus subsp. venerealis cfvi03/293]AIR80911.1 hypothetical protein CFV97608_1293 [Campylobacter fetus subsp. venerealis 97/608]EAK0836161.1 hypothetical protein [Campylobacter fetus]
MNKELFIKEIDDDLEKMRQESRRFFTEVDMMNLLKLLARYHREQEGSNVINIANRLDLLVKDLQKFGEKNAYAYIANFIRNNWEKR